MSQDHQGGNHSDPNTSPLDSTDSVRNPPSLTRQSSSADEAPPSIFYRTAKLLQSANPYASYGNSQSSFWTSTAETASYPPAQTGSFDEPPSSRVFAIAKRFVTGRNATAILAANEPGSRNVSSPGKGMNPLNTPKQSLWTWISGSGASLVGQRPNRSLDDESPLTISPPPRIQYSSQGATVRTLENEVVKLPSLLNEQRSLESNDNMRSPCKVSDATMSLLPMELSNDISKQEAISRICSFCESSPDLPTRPFTLPSGGTLKGETISVKAGTSKPKVVGNDLIEFIYKTAVLGPRKWKQSDACIVVEVFDDIEDANRADAALRLVVFLLVLLDLSPERNFDFIQEACRKLSSEQFLTETKIFDCSTRPPYFKGLFEDFCAYIAAKCNLLHEFQFAMDGNFSIERFIISSSIEAVDPVQNAMNCDVVKNLFGADTITDLGALLGRLSYLAQTFTDSIAQIAPNNNQKPSDDAVTEDVSVYDSRYIMSIYAMKSETIEIISFSIVKEAFLACQALQYFVIIRSELEQAGMTVRYLGTSKAHDLFDISSLISCLRTLATTCSDINSRESLLSDRFQISEDNMQASLDTSIFDGEVLRMRVDINLGATLTTENDIYNPSYFPQSKFSHGVACHFSSFKAMHIAMKNAIEFKRRQQAMQNRGPDSNSLKRPVENDSNLPDRGLAIFHDT